MYPSYDRVRVFLQSLEKEEPSSLSELRRQSEEEGIPIIRTEMRDFLKTLLMILEPKHILEAGTATGYSALWMAEVLSQGGRKDDFHIDTMELEEKNAAMAEENFHRFHRENLITLYRGDAAEVMRHLTEKNPGKLYDLVFIDAAKAQYRQYFREAKSLVHPGSVILADNIFLDGEIFESHYLVEKRDRTMHDRMRTFLKELKSDESLMTSFLAVGDGISFSVVKEGAEQYAET